MLRSIKAIAMASTLILTVTAVGFAQDLIISGPGDVLVDGKQKKPYTIMANASIGANAYMISQSTTHQLPAGKSFICTYASVRLEHSGAWESIVEPATFEVHVMQGSTFLTKDYFSLDPNRDLSIRHRIQARYNIFMPIMPTSDSPLTFNIYGVKRPVADAGELIVILSGYLIDRE